MNLRAMPLIGPLFRDAWLDKQLLCKHEKAVREFLQRAPLDQSTLILDGPGIGLCTPLWILSMLGIERLKKLKAIHCFSASSFYLFWYYAKSSDQLCLSKKTAEEYYLKNQYDRGVRRGKSIAYGLLKKLSGAKWIHPNEVLCDCLLGTVTEEYLFKKMSSWPANVHFWTYDRAQQEFIDLSSEGRYPEFPTGSLIQATSAIPGLFEPMHYKDCEFIDPILAPGIRDHVRDLRKSSSNLLIAHMHREYKTDDIISVKLHSDPSGRRRIVWDYLHWLGGGANLEFGEAFRHGLFELKPL